MKALKVNAALSARGCAAVMVLAALIAFPVNGALQLVTGLDPSLGAPVDGDGDSWAPVISPDGRFVLFASRADNLVSLGGSNGIPRLNPPVVNVYLRDRLNQTTTLVSGDLAGDGGGDGNSFPTALSTNGQFALFESTADNLTTNVTGPVNNVFLRDTVNGLTWLVSVATNGNGGNGGSRGSTLTPDGRFVAFASDASNLVANDTNGIGDVFVRDMQSGTTTCASPGATSGGAGTSSESPEITPDGRYVCFYSTATNLVSTITSSGEIYVRDLQAGVTTWASTNARAISGLGANGYCYNQAISDNGQYVAYEISSNSPFAATGFIFRYNQQTGWTDTVFTNAAVPPGANQDKRSLNLTPDGRFVVFSGNNSGNKATGVYLWDSQAGTNVLASGNFTNGVTPGANSYWPDVDASGRYVVFVSTDTNMFAQGGNTGGVFLRDVQNGTTTLISVDTNGNAVAVNAAAVPVLSANASSVGFESPWANLDGRNELSDVFVRDLTNTVSELISAHGAVLNSVSPNGPSELWSGSVSTNGRYIAFSSWASNLTPSDTNRSLDVFVRDLATGGNILVSVGLNGLTGNNYSDEPAISGNGRYVVFTSAATNLIAGDTNRVTDVFVRDLHSGVTGLATIGTNGGFGNGLSHMPWISVDGRYILFLSRAQNLASNTDTNENLYLRDCQAGQTVALTTAGCETYAATPDGSNVAFVGSIGQGSNLYVWNSAAAMDVYTNTSAALTNIAISPDAHWLVYVAGTGLFAQDLTAGTNVQIAIGPFGLRAGLDFSADARFLTYAGTNDVFLYDFQSGTNLLVSHAYDSTSPANGVSDSPVISPDGRFVAFRSFASNCVASDSNGAPDVFLFDSLSNETILASANLSGAAGNNRSFIPLFSGDGQTLAFQSWASDLTAQDFSIGSDLLTLDVFNLAGSSSGNPPAGLASQITSAGNEGSTAPAGLPLVNWALTPGQSYEVQFKDNLADPVWSTLTVPVVFIGNQAFLYDSSLDSPARFYRIVSGN